MPDAKFSDPRLARIYDAFEQDRPDLIAYRQLAFELDAGHVLDLGCGTGSLALLLAADGRRVTGVDPAAASLEVAAAKPLAQGSTGAVRWVHGDASVLAATFPDGSERPDLAVMTGNVAQVFLTDEDWEGTLSAVRQALGPGRWLVFETRRPERQAWKEWQTDTGPHRRQVPGLGEVVQTGGVTEVDPPYVSFDEKYLFPDGSVVESSSTLRFRTQAEVEASLERCGFEVVEIRQAPDRPGLEFVFCCRSLAEGRSAGSLP